MNQLKPLNYIERAYFEIKSILLNDEVIRKLLFIDSPDALEKVAPSTQEVTNYIFISPIVETAIKDFSRNTFMMIDIPRVTVMPMTNGRNAVIGTGIIAVFTKTNQWLLNNNRLRINAILDRIIVLLHEKKLSSIGPLIIQESDRMNFDDQTSGMLVAFSLMDDQTVGDI